MTSKRRRCTEWLLPTLVVLSCSLPSALPDGHHHSHSHEHGIHSKLRDPTGGVLVRELGSGEFPSYKGFHKAPGPYGPPVLPYGAHPIPIHGSYEHLPSLPYAPVPYHEVKYVRKPSKSKGAHLYKSSSKGKGKGYDDSYEGGFGSWISKSFKKLVSDGYHSDEKYLKDKGYVKYQRPIYHPPPTPKLVEVRVPKCQPVVEKAHYVTETLIKTRKIPVTKVVTRTKDIVRKEYVVNTEYETKTKLLTKYITEYAEKFETKTKLLTKVITEYADPATVYLTKTIPVYNHEPPKQEYGAPPRHDSDENEGGYTLIDLNDNSKSHEHRFVLHSSESDRFDSGESTYARLKRKPSPDDEIVTAIRRLE